MLRGQKVFAKAKSDGSFAAEAGRVEVRYKRTDARAYRASVGNLVRESGSPILEDDACVPAELASEKPSKGSSKPKVDPSAHVHVASATAWIAYTDGACSGNPGPAGAGMVVIVPGGKHIEGFEYLGEGTNNIAELMAILRAVEAMPEEAQEILVHTDSSYSIGVLTKNWKAKANQELVLRAKKVVAARRAKLKYVPGHAGVPLNERADELAREAIRTRSTRALRV